MIRPLNTFDLSPPNGEADALDVLKWLVSVMDRDDKGLHFVASVLASAARYGGITEKQAIAVENAYDRVLKLFNNGALAIQGGRIDKDDGPSNVTHLRPRGAA